MGQAFDKDGAMLGEMYAETKREVFDGLMAAHPDAAEIRIRSMAPADSAPNSPSVGMPRYRCHKDVWALKIAAVIDPTEPGNESDGSQILRFEDATFGPLRVDHAYMRKHHPHAGGYYVVYKDGYASFSPAFAFEEGYTKI